MKQHRPDEAGVRAPATGDVRPTDPWDVGVPPRLAGSLLVLRAVRHPRRSGCAFADRRVGTQAHSTGSPDSAHQSLPLLERPTIHTVAVDAKTGPSITPG